MPISVSTGNSKSHDLGSAMFLVHLAIKHVFCIIFFDSPRKGMLNNLAAAPNAVATCVHADMGHSSERWGDGPGCKKCLL